LMGKVEELGGFIKALESGWLRSEQEKESRRLQAEFQSGNMVFVGVNKYAMNSHSQIKCFRTPPEAAKIATERLKRLRKERDEKKVEEALSNLRQAAKEQGQLMPALIDAVKCYATLGEVTEVMQEVLGSWREGPVTV